MILKLLLTRRGEGRHKYSYRESSTTVRENPIALTESVSTLITVRRNDVIHAFNVHSLRLRVDAIPRRSNRQRIDTSIARLHSFQCQELCRARHSNMTRALHILP